MTSALSHSQKECFFWDWIYELAIVKHSSTRFDMECKGESRFLRFGVEEGAARGKWREFDNLNKFSYIIPHGRLRISKSSALSSFPRKISVKDVKWRTLLGCRMTETRRAALALFPQSASTKQERPHVTSNPTSAPASRGEKMPLSLCLADRNIVPPRHA